jgi:hypothetical protein
MSKAKNHHKCNNQLSIIHKNYSSIISMVIVSGIVFCHLLALLPQVFVTSKNLLKLSFFFFSLLSPKNSFSLLFSSFHLFHFFKLFTLLFSCFLSFFHFFKLFSSFCFFFFFTFTISITLKHCQASDSGLSVIKGH